jgi:lipopolysaccharide/colanic/teichoic acid biosynthesis glycosyltransferase
MAEVGEAAGGYAAAWSGRLWLVGPTELTSAAATLVPTDVEVELANEPNRVAPAEPVFLVGLAAAEIVETAEVLLQRGHTVFLLTTDFPVLHRSLGATRWGLRCVPLRKPSADWFGLAVSRVRDIVVATIVLALLAPLLALLCLLVRRSSPGPALFITEVVGLNGDRFTWRKLRSMRVSSVDDQTERRARYRAFISGRPASPEAGPAVGKILDGSRVTSLGRFLRRHSLDELPQLWNVLVGDMSLVGPRPCLPYEYEMQAGWPRLRYRVRPGLTGAWQAFGRSRTSFDEMVLIDYCYGGMKSPWLDLKLMLRSLWVMATGEGGV